MTIKITVRGLGIGQENQLFEILSGILKVVCGCLSYSIERE